LAKKRIREVSNASEGPLLNIRQLVKTTRREPTSTEEARAKELSSDHSLEDGYDMGLDEEGRNLDTYLIHQRYFVCRGWTSRPVISPQQRLCSSTMGIH